VSPGEQDTDDRRVGSDQSRALTAVGDRPRPWSREDLLQRLERLPRGHPSSPCNADGTRKPPPPNLRALELPLPAAETAGDAATGQAPAQADVPRTDPAETADVPGDGGAYRHDRWTSDLESSFGKNGADAASNQSGHAEDRGEL
jgi:hypothetical protein